MINVRSKQYKELPISIISSVAFLTLIGLIVLKSISQHQSGGLLNNPFNKQILLLIPAIIFSLFVLILPRYTIQNIHTHYIF